MRIKPIFLLALFGSWGCDEAQLAQHDAGFDSGSLEIDSGNVEESDSGPADSGRAVFDAGPPPPNCELGTAQSVVTLTLEGVNEMSGLAVSKKNEDVFWTHNDHGNDPNVYAFSRSGVLLAAYSFGVPMLDFEDMTFGPGPDPEKDYIYMGDVGDNLAEREHIVIYRVAEPTVSATQEFVFASLPDVEPLVARYPDGPHNAETVFVDPTNQDLYVITKDLFRGVVSRVFRLAAPHVAVTPRTLEEVARIYVGDDLDHGINGGDITPDGKKLIVRTYFHSRIYERPLSQTIGEMISTTTGCTAFNPSEPKGEAVAWAPDQSGYYTVSEGDSVTLYFVPTSPNP